jgi:hypothetical protein
MDLSKINEQLNNIDERKGYDEVNLLLTSNQKIKLAIADITKNSVIALNDSADTTFFETLSREIVLANINALSKGDINLTYLNSLSDKELLEERERKEKEFIEAHNKLIGEKKELENKISGREFVRNLIYILIVIVNILILIIGFYLE